MSVSALLMVMLVMEMGGGGGGMGVEAYSGKVLLVSMDGFRWDYVSKVSGLRHFPALAESGCSVEHVDNPFATVTFPSHYTLVTGLYEESHGIVANKMYDRKRNATFTMSSTESFWWNQGEPVWVTAEKQRKNSTATMFWPGSEAEIRGFRPSIYRPYQHDFPFPDRVKMAVTWLMPPYSKDFVSLYFNEPDSTGHKFGPDSPEVAAKVREMDGILGQILSELEKNKLTDVVNVIVTSDHGMTNVNVTSRLIDLWKYVNKSLVELVPDDGPVTAILPRPGQEAEVARQAAHIPHVTAYLKHQIPDHFRYRDNDRIMPVIVIAEEGWMLSSNLTDHLSWNPRGNHGYSNELQSMKPIFYARGPDFRQGVRSPSIRSVDLYPLLCRLLHIRAAPNNGSLTRTAHFLKDGGSGGSQVTAHAHLVLLGPLMAVLWLLSSVLIC